VIATLHPRAELSPGQRAAMLTLMQEHFAGVTPGTFAADLDEKDWVILLENECRRVLGFTTLLCYASAWAAGPVRVITSGDTIVAPEARHGTALARVWLEAVQRWLPAAPTPLYWLLLTSGHRTYRFLPVFWREFWPRHDAPERPALLRVLARERYGPRFEESSGLVRLEHPQVLRDPCQGSRRCRPADPHVAFFRRSNPDHALGDELACLCPLTGANQTAAGRRLVAL
jgi:hypothetical protein